MPEAYNLTGRKFGRLTVTKLSPKKNKKIYWTCICECGTEKSVLTTYLVTGKIISCGCSKRETPNHAYTNLEGKKFEKLTVIRQVESTDSLIRYKCQCDCGRFTLRTPASNLIRGRSKSCGICVKENLIANPIDIVGASLYSTYKSGSVKRSLEFLLTQEQFNNLITDFCWYCGRKGCNLAKNGRRGQHQLRYNGIDRKDNLVGYTLENCVTCCKQCNFAKGKMSMYDFLSYLESLRSYTGGVWKREFHDIIYEQCRIIEGDN